MANKSVSSYFKTDILEINILEIFSTNEHCNK